MVQGCHCTAPPGCCSCGGPATSQPAIMHARRDHATMHGTDDSGSERVTSHLLRRRRRNRLFAIGIPRQGGNIQSFLATPTRIYTTVYVYVYRYTAYTIYRQHGAKFCQVLSSLPCIRARPYHCISWADSTPTRIYTTLLHYKIYTTLRIFAPC